MKIELQEHHIAEIRDKIDNWPAARLSAQELRDDCRKLLEHIEWQQGEINRIDEAWREFTRRDI